MFRVQALLLVVLAASCGGLNAGMPTCFVAQLVPAPKTGPGSFCRRHALGPLEDAANGLARVRAMAPCMMNAAPGDDGAPADDVLQGKKFVSRKLTDALLETPTLGTLPGTTPVRPSKRALVRKAATRLVSWVLGSKVEQPPPLMGEKEDASSLELWRAELGASAPSGSMSKTQRLAADAQAETDRVFDLLNKYSQRHSNGTVPVMTTISGSFERKPLQRSRYANLYDPESDRDIKKSKSGKVLQKSKYADVWSAQDEVTNRLPPTTKSVTKSLGKPPVYGSQAGVSKYVGWCASENIIYIVFIFTVFILYNSYSS